MACPLLRLGCRRRSILLVTAAVDVQQEVRERIARLVEEARLAKDDPAELLRHTKAIDTKTGEEFFFHFDKGWDWQRDELNSYRDSQVVVRLKARQLGVS